MIKIKHIVKEHDCFPIRWWLRDEDDNVYTIRERGGECVIHHGIKSIFSVTEEDIITEFQVGEESNDSTLPVALLKMNAILLPNAGNASVDVEFNGC